MSTAHITEFLTDLNVPLSKSGPLEKAAVNFNERLYCCNLMEQLNHLCRGIQRHRGFSLGLLGGNTSFGEEFHILQSQMGRRIELLSAFARRPPILFSHADVERIHSAWSTICDNWQGDSVLENYEFHSHFIDQLLLLMARFAEKLRQPFAEAVKALLSKAETELDEQSPYQQLLFFCCQHLPRYIEMLGKVRALSVHVAATGYCDDDYTMKLRYLLQCITQEAPIISELTSNLQRSVMGELPSLLTIKTYEYKLDYFLEKVSKEVVAQSALTIKAEELFTISTEIIDVYWRIVDDGLSLLHRWQKEDLEQWLLEG